MLGRRAVRGQRGRRLQQQRRAAARLVAASGSSDIRDGDQYWAFVNGSVTKHATRVRVLFDLGIPPPDIEPIQSGDRFPVNFFTGWYRMPARHKRPATWQVVRVVAYGATGRQVAECRVGGPAGNC